MVSCASIPLEHSSDMWQYDDDKFVSFKTPINMSWEYDDPTIGCFEIDRECETMSKADIDKITKFMKDENKKELIELENKYKPIKFKDDAISYPAKDEREFIDQEKPHPNFKYICFYRLFAVEKCGSQIATPLRSDPVDLSVMILRPIKQLEESLDRHEKKKR